MRSKIIELIEAEAAAGPAGRIVIKVNGLDDPAIIDALYAASAAGVKIDLVIRAICCLRPGVPGLSETIRVRSIVGRFLEHSRIFRFGGVGDRPEVMLIGSADLRRRNLDRRIEATVPVVDAELRGRLREVLDLLLADDTQAWSLGWDGCWSRVPTETGISTQRSLMAAALERAQRRREPDKLASAPDRRPNWSRSACSLCSWPLRSRYRRIRRFHEGSNCSCSTGVPTRQS